MVLKQKVTTLWNKIRGYPKRYTVPSGVIIILALLYGIIFFIDKPVAFSYAGSTCTRFLVLFPDTQKSTSGEYAVTPVHPLKIGSFTLAAQAVCFTPIQPPREGVSRVSLSPHGGAFLHKTFTISVNPAPTVSVAELNKPVPLSRPLTVPLSDTDKVFAYQIKVKKRQAACDSIDKAISCDVRALKLAQGKRYTIELIRRFNNVDVAVVAEKDVKTLSATRVAKASIKSGDTIYAKPKSFILTFDKRITKATPVLYKVDGGKRTPITTSVHITEKKVKVTTPKDLPRSTDFELTAKAVEARDGSGLEETYKLPFKTSGGPKVVGVSIGTSGVALGSTVVVTFDQPISQKQDVAKIVAATGGAAVSGRTGNQLLVSLAGVGKCKDFAIKVGAGLKSNYDVTSNASWNFASRTICHTVGTIGYSSGGRAINAYYFGSGPSVVLYTGAIHGNEISTKYLMEAWINELEANARNIPAGKTVVVVPQINPDGVASGSRVNARNVDLNRNFSTNDWKKDITTVNNQPFPGGGGKSPMSEPETKAIAGLASQLHPALILSYHSVGGVLAANQAGASNTHANTYSQLSGYSNTTGRTGETFEYSVTGTADDWYGQKLGVASILIELGSGTYHEFGRNQKAMWAMLNNS